MANTEQIEAKLCAYVDGELDAAGRAEIEAHLASNPQHRMLLEELMQQRELLRDLPREKALEDLSEALQAQLERSVLLGSQKSPVAGKISYWPQVMAMAAVLLLAVGLAAVIYMVLPNQNKQFTNYTMLPATTAPSGAIARIATTNESTPTAVALAPAPSIAADAIEHNGKFEAKSAPATTAEDLSRTSEALAPPAPAPAASPAPTTYAFGKSAAAANETDIFSNRAVANQSKGGDAFKEQSANIFDQPPLSPEIQQHVTQSPQIPSNSVVFVVASNNPTATDQQVTGYLGQNNIRWDDVTEPMPTHPELRKEMVFESKMQSRQVRLRDSTTLASKQGQPYGEAAKKLDQEQQKVVAVAQRQVATTQPTKDRQMPEAPAQQPTQELVTADQLAQSQTTQQQAQSVQQQSQSSRYIVARNLTPQQISDLGMCLNYQNSGRIANYRRNGSEITPTTLPAMAMSQMAMQIREPLPRQMAEATDEKTKDADLRDKAAMQPGSRPTAPSATTQPALGAVAVTAAPTTVPTAVAISTPAPVSAPTTQRATTVPTFAQAVGGGGAGATSHPATTNAIQEERLDVVIVVKSDPGESQRAAEVPAVTPPPALPAVTAPVVTAPAPSAAQAPALAPAAATTAPTATPPPPRNAPAKGD